MRSLGYRRPSAGLIVAIVALVLCGAGSAVATHLITGSQIAKHTIGLGNLTSKARRALAGKRGPAGPAGPRGATGPAGVNGGPGISGVSNGYFLARTTDVNPLPHPATTVATLTALPAGSYLITGHVSAVNFSADDYVRCSISVGGTSIGGSTAFVGSTASSVADLITTAPSSSTTAFDASLTCSHDNSANGPYVESIWLSAIQVNHLDSRTSASAS